MLKKVHKQIYIGQICLLLKNNTIMWLSIHLKYQRLLKWVKVSPTNVLVFELPAQCVRLFLKDIAYTLVVDHFWPFEVSKIFDSGGVGEKLLLLATYQL